MLHNSSDLILVLKMLYREQKYTRIVIIISCTYLLGTKIHYWQEQKYTGAKYKTNLCHTETINWFGQ
jgi:hypothetical protein